MAPLSRRIHGCAACKARKVKCDCMWPQCTQCTRLGRACPGTSAGLIFINTRVDPGPLEPLKDPHAHKVQSISTAGDITSAVKHRYSMPGPPPLIRNLNQEHLYHLATDISSYQRTPWTPNPWFMDVPTLILPGHHEVSVIASMRAVSLAFLAIKCQSQGLEKSARSFYATGLRLHSEAVSRISDNKHGSLEPKWHSALLVTSMLLFEFEMMFPSSPYSWMSHAQGAAHILEKIGPQSCQEMRLHKIFLVLRHIVAYISLATGTASFLGSTDWIEVPFVNHCKNGIDHLIDHLLRLSQVKEHNPGFLEDGEMNLEVLHDIRDSLDLWWTKRKRQPVQSNRQDGSHPPVLGNTVHLKVLGILCSIGQVVTHFKQTIIDPTYNRDRDGLDEHSAYILSSAGCSLSNTMPLRIQLHTLFALYIVALYATCSVQREQAHNLIQQYQQSRIGKVWVSLVK